MTAPADAKAVAVPFPKPQGPSGWHAAVTRVLEAHAEVPGALLPILHAVQDELGYVPSAAVPVIGKALNLSRAEVHGVVTYYHHFRTEAPARHVLQVCRAEACQSMGGEALLAHAHECVKGKADGEWAVEPVFCLGLCASSPAVMVDDKLHARVTARRLDALVGAAA